MSGLRCRLVGRALAAANMPRQFGAPNGCTSSEDGTAGPSARRRYVNASGHSDQHISGDTYLNDFHYYDAQANAWVSPTPSSGTAPAARYGHTCVWDATGGKVWIFGGLSSSSIRLSDLNYYDEAANAWVSVTPISGSASGRLFHAAAWDDAGASMWIFGGYDGPGLSIGRSRGTAEALLCSETAAW
eukprot:Skav217677  [mRNA]  locus=scaffold2919:356195:359991:+ [translate_table: standard]